MNQLPPQSNSPTCSRLCALMFVLLAISLSSGCAIFKDNNSASAEQEKRQEQHMTRQELNEGYSLLYMAADSLSGTNKALYVKVESDRVQKVVVSASDFAGELKSDLERVAKDYPAVKINLDPLPVIEKRKRSSLSSEMVKSLAPVAGKTGAAFERKLLLSSAGVLVQLQFQCEVMAEQEPVDSLRKFLTDSGQRFRELYEAEVKLLNEVYFKHNVYEPGKL